MSETFAVRVLDALDSTAVAVRIHDGVWLLSEEVGPRPVRSASGMTEEVCEVIITAPDAEWLVQFTRSLVDDRLCACGHNITPIRSIYRWQGAVHDEAEARVALHTRRTLVPEIINRANREHPYEVPCVIALPIAEGNPAYVRWILDETNTSAPPA